MQPGTRGRSDAMAPLLLLLMPLLPACAAYQVPWDKVQGRWRTVMLATDSPESVRDGAPLLTYVRSIRCSDACARVRVTFYVKTRGNECRKMRLVARRKKKRNVYGAQYEGENFPLIDYVSSRDLVLHLFHKDRPGGPEDEEPKVIRVVLGLARGRKMSREGRRKFQEAVEKNGIEDENVRNLTASDTCPS